MKAAYESSPEDFSASDQIKAPISRSSYPPICLAFETQHTTNKQSNIFIQSAMTALRVQCSSLSVCVILDTSRKFKDPALYHQNTTAVIEPDYGDSVRRRNPQDQKESAVETICNSFQSDRAQTATPYGSFTVATVNPHWTPSIASHYRSFLFSFRPLIRLLTGRLKSIENRHGFSRCRLRTMLADLLPSFVLSIFPRLRTMPVCYVNDRASIRVQSQLRRHHWVQWNGELCRGLPLP